VVAGLVPIVSAQAQDSGGVNVTVNTAVRSISVTPSSATYGDCSGGSADALNFPNGECRAPSSQVVPASITVANGPVSGHVNVTGASFFGLDMDTNSQWQLCNTIDNGLGGNPGCTGASGVPGQNQAHESAVHAANTLSQIALGTAAQCDNAFVGDNSGCTASANQSEQEYLSLVGPSSTTNPTSTFSTTVTWTAVP